MEDDYDVTCLPYISDYTTRPERIAKLEYKPWMATGERDQKRRLGKLGVEPWADRTVDNYLKMRNNMIDSYNHERKLAEIDRDYVEKKEKARRDEIQRKEDEDCERISQALYDFEKKVKYEFKYKKIIEDVFRRNKYDLAELKGRRPYVALAVIRRKMLNMLKGGTHYLNCRIENVKQSTAEKVERIRSFEEKLRHRPSQKFEEKLRDLELDLEWPLLRQKVMEPVIPACQSVNKILDAEMTTYPAKIGRLLHRGGRLKGKRRRRHRPLELSETYRVPAEEIPYVDLLGSFLEQMKLGAKVTTTELPVPKRIRLYRERKKIKELNLDPRFTTVPKSKKERYEMEKKFYMRDAKKLVRSFHVASLWDCQDEYDKVVDITNHLRKADRCVEERREMDRFQYYMYGEQEMYEVLDIENNEVRPPEYKHTPAPDYFPKPVDPEEQKRKAEEKKKAAQLKYNTGITKHSFRRTIFKLEKILGIPPITSKPNELTVDELCGRIETVFEEFLKTFTGRNIGCLMKRFEDEEHDILLFERHEKEKEAARARNASSSRPTFTAKSPPDYKPKYAYSAKDEILNAVDKYDGYATPHEMYESSDEDCPRMPMEQFIENRRKKRYSTPKYDSRMVIRKTDDPVIRKVKKEVPILAEIREQIIEDMYYKRKHFA